MSEEQRPLLSNLGDASPPLSSRATVISVRPISNEDLPVIAQDGTTNAPTTTCQVCEASINLEGKLQQHVIKCSQCNEANPIKPPPLGKKYVRCPCHCLLICKQTSQRIACPRRNCNRVMQVSDTTTEDVMIRQATTPNPVPLRARVLCAYCSEPFSTEGFHISVHDMNIVRCPQCSRRSFINSYYRFKRMIIWYTLALLLIITGFILLGVLSGQMGQAGAVAAWLVPLILGGIFGCVAIYYTFLKVSQIM